MSKIMERFKVWLHNFSHIHHRLMAEFLRKRNWVAFYLEPTHRDCKDGTCWMKAYESSLRR